MNRRNFIQVIGLSSLFGSSILNASTIKNNRSVIWLWLGGGSTHIETFNPIPDAPSEYRSVTGHLTGKNGIQLGGSFNKLIKHTDKINVVRSFSHGDSSHNTGTHWVMTGHKNPNNNGEPKYPGFGAITSYIYGSNNSINGVPTYVRSGSIEGDGPVWLGEGYKPFDANGEGVKNLSRLVQKNQFEERRDLLNRLDKDLHFGGTISDLREQAYNVLSGDAKRAFTLDEEPQNIRETYGKNLGEKLLLARRLTDFGAKFVTIHHGGWDHHSDINKAFSKMGPELDNAISALLEDLYNSGKNEQVLLVVTGEFGRTPKVNSNAGRDHWPQLSTLMFAGGPYTTGRIIGESSKKGEYPNSKPITPIDVHRTLMDYFEIPLSTQKQDNTGRPRYLLEGESSNILT